MDPKITILFVLIAAIIGLSYLSDANLTYAPRNRAALARPAAGAAQNLSNLHAHLLKASPNRESHRRARLLPLPPSAGCRTR